MTLTGTGFTNASAVTFGGVAGTSISNVTDTSLTVVAPAGTGHGGRAGDDAARHERGRCDGEVHVRRDVAGDYDISPTAGQAGTVVTITGTGFLGATSVTFGGTAGTSMTATATSITVTAPAGTGTVDVVVNGPLGASPVGAQPEFT
ncbi:MAG: IPT/TIG domain-containing protein [Thermoflexaceae bacterium]|nr:IPT/TIG domain-containing protein [Thermoflexaceae bacterium]